MRILLAIICASCLASCKDKDGLPSGILQKDTMQAVLWEVIQADAFTTQFTKKDTLKNAAVENARLQQQIFAIHNIKKEDFYDSYDYYSTHGDLMRVLLDSISTKGEREKYTTLYNKPAIPVEEKFSLLPLPPPPPPVFIPMPIPSIYSAGAHSPSYTGPKPATPFKKLPVTKPIL